MWFTRNAKDYTERYGPVLTPHILAGVSAHKCILDGEVSAECDDGRGSREPRFILWGVRSQSGWVSSFVLCVRLVGWVVSAVAEFASLAERRCYGWFDG